MAALLDPNRLATFGALVIAALVIAVLKTVPEGAGERYAAGRRYHRAGKARHARTTAPAAIPTSALTTIPDARAFAARTF